MSDSIVKRVQAALFAMQDSDYRAFHCALMPTVDPNRVIGVRTPALRRYAGRFAKSETDAAHFLACLPHVYYEENNLHACLLEKCADYDALIRALDAFLPYVDNWATCDMLSPRLFKTHPPRLLAEVSRWLSSTHTYTIRFGIGVLLKHYLDDAFSPAHLARVAEIQSDEYYVKMMVAWYFATALAKQYDATLPYLLEQRLPVWTHNKAIQKAIESNRIPAPRKAYLRTLKV